MDLKEIGINKKNWVDWTQDRNYWGVHVNVALNLRVPYAMKLVFISIYLFSTIYKNFHTHELLKVNR